MGPCGIFSAQLLRGSWDLVSKVISTSIGAIGVCIVTLLILLMTLATKSHDPPMFSVVMVSRFGLVGGRAFACMFLGFSAIVPSEPRYLCNGLLLRGSFV